MIDDMTTYRDAIGLLRVLREAGLTVVITGTVEAEVTIRTLEEGSADMSWYANGHTTEAALFACAGQALTYFRATASAMEPFIRIEEKP